MVGVMSLIRHQSATRRPAETLPGRTNAGAMYAGVAGTSRPYTLRCLHGVGQALWELMDSAQERRTEIRELAFQRPKLVR
jgi:hypothetical protein